MHGKHGDKYISFVLFKLLILGFFIEGAPFGGWPYPRANSVYPSFHCLQNFTESQVTEEGGGEGTDMGAKSPRCSVGFHLPPSFQSLGSLRWPVTLSKPVLWHFARTCPFAKQLLL